MAIPESELSFDGSTGSAVMHTETSEPDRVDRTSSIFRENTPEIAEMGGGALCTPLAAVQDEEASVASSEEDDVVLPIADLSGNLVDYPDRKASRMWRSSAVGSGADMNPFRARAALDIEPASAAPSFDDVYILPIADVEGNLVQYPGMERGEEQQQSQDELQEEVAVTKAKRSVITGGLESLKYIYSCALLVFAVVIVMASIFQEQTVGTAERGIPSGAAVVVFWFLIIWLAMMEGGQGALVGLQPIDTQLFAESHPKTLKCTTLAHKGDNMERFIVGRQFLVVLVVFVINMMASTIKGASVFGFSDIMNEIFLDSGLAAILTTIMIGQLTAQVNAANCMLDFINNYLMLFTTYVSLFIEFSGLLHCTYLVQSVFSKIFSKTPIENKEPPRSPLQSLFFWFRVVMSLIILGFCFAVTLAALFQGKTAMWDGVPASASVVIFFLLMFFVGLMEGMQIALFAVANLPEVALRDHKTALANRNLTFQDQNLQAFLIGRQICVTICTFIVARITSLDVDTETGENIFGVSDGLQEFFNTGLLGAVITTIVGSLAWRIIASSFPIAFLSNPLVSIIIRLCLLLEASGVCSAAWVLGRWNKLIVGYQPDNVYLEGAEKNTSVPVTRRDKDIDRTISVIKYTYSLALLIFSVVVIMGAIFQEQTVGTAERGIPPGAAFVVFWILIVWLAMMEGGQGALVGLQPIDTQLFAESHPKTLKCTTLAHKGDNMERFIVGRQFLVVLVVFLINIMSSATDGASVFGFPDVLNEIFLASGLAVILTTIMIGQLTAQVNAANCMLDFVNNYLMLFTTYVSLFIEFSGLLHCVYLVQIAFAKMMGTNIESKEPPRSAFQSLFFWFRVLVSVVILGFCFAVTLAALFQGKTTMWDGVPAGASIVIFFLLMCFVGLMEGMQIALFAVVNLPEEKVQQHRVASANCKLAFEGQNLQAFLIGRQICVTLCTFVIARITSLDVKTGTGENIFGVSDGVQGFFNTGLLGAVITTIIGSLAWRIIASSFPLGFLSNPLIYVIIRVCLLLELTGVCSASWVLGRWNKLVIGYQPDAVYLEGAEPQGRAPVTRRDKDVDTTITTIKYMYSLALLLFSIVIVMAAIFSEQTTMSMEVHPAFALLLFWFLLIWLAMMEGGQGALVGLQPIDTHLFAESHPKTLKCTTLAHKGNNMERFIIGRQFLVVLVVFVTNLCGAAIKDAQVLNLPDVVTEVFLSSGLAVILTTIIIGQLTAQVNAANCMLDFVDTYFMLFTVYVSLFIEFSGLLHCVYLVQIFFSKVTGNTIESKEPPRNSAQKAFFWTRVFMSLIILGFAFAVTLAALFQGKTTMWPSIPAGASVVIFFILMCFVGLMEGMQIALFTVVNMPEEKLEHHRVAAANCEVTFADKNFAAFLIGRQICVTVCMFVVARITTLSVETGSGENIFGVPDGLQEFFNTGLLGAIITTIVASLAWRIVAASFPLAFMSNPLIYLIIRLCLLLELTGVCSAAWLLALVQKQVAGYQHDDVYIGTAEERDEDHSIKDVECGRDREMSDAQKETTDQPQEADTSVDTIATQPRDGGSNGHQLNVAVDDVECGVDNGVAPEVQEETTDQPQETETLVDTVAMQPRDSESKGHQSNVTVDSARS